MVPEGSPTVDIDREDELHPPTHPDLKRHWRTVTVAGFLGMTYFSTCIFGAPRTKFLVELNATELDFGLLAGLGSLSLVFQLFAGVLANRLRRRKPL